MRTYEADNRQLKEVKCNRCGKCLKIEKGVLKEGCYHGDFVWGYFSDKDGMRDTFDLCESCYDKMVKEFALPIESAEVRELL